ncbi:hypothetical protein HMPREF0444_1787 [Granulicatella adiacens ATCC 49175]|uniref:Uncharacterized protein n=1 Tax=Granulicatella adiacens ATCC 49175 TaxID=638301 RepID=C8NIP2_9LACT|nr:hypothetical protein HMPREF0444_1787 [Granulicatella adiacens ATCC 49175]
MYLSIIAQIAPKLKSARLLLKQLKQINTLVNIHTKPKIKTFTKTFTFVKLAMR